MKGDTLPFSAKLTGTYYLDWKGTPGLGFLASKKDVISATTLKSGIAPPVICVGDVDELIAKMNGEAHDVLQDRLDSLNSEIAGGTTSDHDLTTMVQEWGYYVNIKDPKYRCRLLSPLSASKETDDNGYTFTVTVTFGGFKPVVFLDALGMGVFSYKRMPDQSHSHHTSGNPVRFCGGVDYTGDMYTIEPRPKCPVATHPEARHYGRAMISVYKPNIVSVRRNATRCVQHATHVHSYENIFGGAKDCYQRPTWSVRTPPNDCRTWKKSKNACPEMKVRALLENDNVNVNHYSNNPDQCKFKKQFSDNPSATEYITQPDLACHYSRGDINAYDLRDALLTEGFMEVSMPTKTAVTPWMTIPKDRLMDGEYEFNNVTVVWEPFKSDELCPFVPKFRGEVTYIKYKHGDYDFPLDPDTANADEEQYTLFLLAEQYGVLFNVDSSQKILDTSKLRCMPHARDYSTDVYQTGGDQIIVVTRVDDGKDNSESHIPEDLQHLGVDEQPHSAYEAIHYDSSSGKVHKSMGESEQPYYKVRAGDQSKKHDLAQHYSIVSKSNAPGFTPEAKKKYTKKSPEEVKDSMKGAADLTPLQITQTDALAYALFKMQERERENLHIRVTEGCIRRQIEWDLETQFLDQNPSRALSARLNTAVEASLGGNGYYNVKKCELAFGLKVIPTLFTNSPEKITLNGKSIAVRDVVSHLGVKPDPEKCFTMPLVIFKSSITMEEIVGQLSLEGIIKIDKLTYLEACGRNKAFVFMVENTGHFFFNYLRNFTEDASVIKNATERFLEASTPTPTQGTVVTPDLPEIKLAALREEIRKHTLAKIHTITLIEPVNLKEKQFSHYPTGLYSNNLYSIAEFQSVSMGLMKLMEEQNYERFALREFTKEYVNSFTTGTDGGLFSGMGNFLEGTGDFFLKMGEGAGALAYGIGGGIGQAYKGAGEGVGAAGKGVFGGVGDALQGTLMTLGLPLIAVAIIAVVGVIIYKQLSGNDKPPPPYEEEEQEYQPQQHLPSAIPRRRTSTKKRNGFSFQ